MVVLFSEDTINWCASLRGKWWQTATVSLFCTFLAGNSKYVMLYLEDIHSLLLSGGVMQIEGLVT
jgi:hypothetical protein